MGRWSTGAATTAEALRIELSYLLKSGILKKGCEIASSLQWTNGSTIQIETSYNTQAGNYIRLIYTQTDREGNKTDHDYKIYLTTVPSNIGKGEVLYFQCPESGKNCRILYMAYGCPIWKSKAAYKNRIYYQSQVSSKMNYSNDRYWELNREIEKMYKSRRKQLTYKGKPTRFALRLEQLELLMQEYDHLRWSPLNMPKSLRKFF
jgi:hypothetical protein